MEEKKLTDEEIINDLQLFSNLEIEEAKKQGAEKAVLLATLTLDLIRRLQEENERLTSLYDGKSGFMTSSIGDLPLTVAGLRKAVDEISRLLTVQGELQDLNAKYYNEAKDLRRETAELQKQVDELKETLKLRNIQLEDLRKYDKEIVKDTAKEILDMLDSVPTNEVNELNHLRLLKNAIAKRYGVEVK